MDSFKVNRFRSLALTIAALFVLLLASPASTQELPHAVRVIDPTLAATLDEASAASPTLRALLDELERSDVIVHIVLMQPKVDQLGGSLAFVHAVSGRRILRIEVSPRLAPTQRAALLAHELQHALEVARAASVVDAESFAALYERIGYRVSTGSSSRCFETDAARNVASKVLGDIQKAERALARFGGL